MGQVPHLGKVGTKVRAAGILAGDGSARTARAASAITSTERTASWTTTPPTSHTATFSRSWPRLSSSQPPYSPASTPSAASGTLSRIMRALQQEAA